MMHYRPPSDILEGRVPPIPRGIDATGGQPRDDGTISTDDLCRSLELHVKFRPASCYTC